MNLIEKLGEYRLDKKLTQEELAKKLDVSFVTINRWLNCRNKPSILHSHYIKKFLKNV